MKIKLGCDPELFLQDAAGALVASCTLIGGTKDHPRPLPLGEGYAVQEDNVAVEFNVPAAEDREQWSASIGNTIAFLEDAVQEMYGLKFSKLSAAFFPKAQLLHPKALEFGCDPDYNAWTGKKNPRPKAADETLRSCGGHVHIGYEFKDNLQKRRAIQLCDFFLGVPSTLIDEGELRKQLYGKYGAMRFKPYGVEYRTLSNFWTLEDGLRKWVFDNTTKAMEALHSDFDVLSLQQPIMEAINNNNKAVARELVDTYNIPMPV